MPVPRPILSITSDPSRLRRLRRLVRASKDRVAARIAHHWPPVATTQTRRSEAVTTVSLRRTSTDTSDADYIIVNV